MEVSKRLVRKASNGMVTMATTTGAAITQRARKLSDAMKPDPQLTRKISDALSRNNSQKSSDPRHQHRRRPSYQNGQPVPRDQIRHIVAEGDMLAAGVGSRRRSGEYADLLDGVAIAESACRDKQRRMARKRSASLETDASGYVVVDRPAYMPTTPRTPRDGRPRGPPRQPVPDSVLPGQKMRESVSSITFPGTASSASVYSQVTTQAGVEYEIDELDRGLKQFKIEKASPGRAPRDSRGFISPYDVSVQRKGAIKKSMSSGNVNLEVQSRSGYTSPLKASMACSVNPVHDLGRYPRVATHHPREASPSSARKASSSRTRIDHATPARPSVHHSSTAPDRLPSSRSAAPPPQPVRYPTTAPEEAKSWYNPPPAASSAGSSGYQLKKELERRAHSSSKAVTSSSLWLSRTPARSSDALADDLLGCKPRRDRHGTRDVAAAPTVPMAAPQHPVRRSSSHHRSSSDRHTPSQPPPPMPSPHSSVRRSSSHRQAPSQPVPGAPHPSSTRAAHRPPPLVNAFAPLHRSNTYASTTSSPSSLYPPTPPPLPTSTLSNPLQRALPPLPLSQLPAAPAARRVVRQEHAVSAVSVKGDVGGTEWHASYRLGEENIRRRRESESERRREKDRAHGGARI